MEFADQQSDYRYKELDGKTWLVASDYEFDAEDYDEKEHEHHRTVFTD